MVTQIEGRVYFISRNIKSYWELCLFVLKHAPRERLMKGVKLLVLGLLLILLISLFQRRYDSILLVLGIVFSLVGMFLLRWFVYYQVYRKQHVTFKGYGFDYKGRQIKFQQITGIKIHNNSNMTLVISEFPYGYMFIGYNQIFYNQLIEAVRSFKPNIEVSED